ncbi:MAG: hypothetical protein KJ043_05170, partial [Anaerolineae bacterium]|nr:hypothetical protein [Anaerolineae bacterium]
CIELKGWLGGIIYHRMLIRMQTDESQLKRYPVESVKAIKLAPENEFQIYAETMIEAIKNDDPISYLFMGALYHYMKLDDFRKIILIALNQRNRRTLDTAMAFAEQLGMKEAIPLIERLTTHPNDRLRGIAIKALETLMEK